MRKTTKSPGEKIVKDIKRAVSVRCPCTDVCFLHLIVSTIDSGHLEVLHGWYEGTEEAGLD